MPTSAPGSASNRWTRGSPRWRRRYPARLDRRRDAAEPSGPRADRLEADVCRAAGVAPAEVARLAWTGAALRTAREAGR